MIRFMYALCSIVLLSTAVTGCSVKVPSYNPVLGGFPMPDGYIGESMPEAVVLDLDGEPSTRARPKAQSISMR